VNGEQDMMNTSRLPFTVYRSRLSFPPIRTGVRVAEGAGLENRYTLTGIVGSNPTLSVRTETVRKEPRTGEALFDVP
jgi:hypothetical protein